MDRIVVVGASLAGFRAAEALRAQGFDGSLTLVGDEVHAPYDRPPLSKQVLTGEWEPERTTLPSADGVVQPSSASRPSALATGPLAKAWGLAAATSSSAQRGKTSRDGPVDRLTTARP